MRTDKHLERDIECPLGRAGWHTGLPSGKARCPACGRVIYVTKDGTCAPHFKPAFTLAEKA